MTQRLWPQVMLDLETLSSRRDAPIVQIGAMAFDITGDTPDFRGPKFSVNVRPDFDLTPPSFDTMLWWMTQAPETKASVFGSEKDRYEIPEALMYFRDFLAENVILPFEVWAMPPEFDCAILDNARASLKVRTGYLSKPLWAYNATRDLRTLEALAGGDKTTRYPATMLHDAAADAEAQVFTAQHYYQRLKQGG